MTLPKVLIPLPSYGCDPSEVAIPWKYLTENNIEVVFCTPAGGKAITDTIMLTGKGLSILKPVLQARKDAVDAFYEMDKCEAFNNPLPYAEVKESHFNAIYLPGGHDKGVKEYLEASILQNLIVAFFNKLLPVGAICHGVVLVARSIDPKTKKSVLHQYQTTALLKSQEILAYNLTRLGMKDYYLTYPGLPVEDEIKNNLIDANNFKQGPKPLLRDRKTKMNRGFIVKDRNYLSGRWPGDLYNLSTEFVKMVQIFSEAQSTPING